VKKLKIKRHQTEDEALIEAQKLANTMHTSLRLEPHAFYRDAKHRGKVYTACLKFFVGDKFLMIYYIRKGTCVDLKSHTTTDVLPTQALTIAEELAWKY